ncbi:hypothetical protein MSAN_01693900 [Mycena sanguinolenta]|uniref:Uncharacterized protein n=1 Tax=Mycena sanguinolenta TaxID=230812 RepID=A0A8H6XY07_9AGAR|nr:hypothetical protein MSAN_01693900 [Mycena sanguinolenta]
MGAVWTLALSCPVLSRLRRSPSSLRRCDCAMRFSPDASALPSAYFTRSCASTFPDFPFAFDIFPRLLPNSNSTSYSLLPPTSANVAASRLNVVDFTLACLGGLCIGSPPARALASSSLPPRMLVHPALALKGRFISKSPRRSYLLVPQQEGGRSARTHQGACPWRSGRRDAVRCGTLQ